MTDKSVELQNLLIQKLINSDKTPVSTGPSTISTISIIVLITILLIVGGVVIYYILSQNLIKPYPISIFKYGDKVVIRPAILCDIEGDKENQYLTQVLPVDANYFYTCQGEGYCMGQSPQHGSALRFIGNPNDRQSQWVLEQFSAEPAAKPFDASQSLTLGLGNRFYLRNNRDDQVRNQATRVRYQVANESVAALCPSTTPMVIGAGDFDGNYFSAELIVYFLPTNYPDIYYILFPNCSDTSGIRNYLNTTGSPNNGIATIRPFSRIDNNRSRSTTGVFCSNTKPCNPNDVGNYNPYKTEFELYDNILLNNLITADNLIPPFPNYPPNVSLFKVTKVP
jgi:hypothetical protein